jgi:prepilin-type N-terminal cleavage/methylation domain-containing protein
MPTILRRQDGFTLVELLLVMTISLIVFGATLSSWTSVYRGNRQVEKQNDNAEEARVALDRAARQLRNLANPTVNAITTIDRATDYDFIFQTSDPSKTWIRYCLQTTGAGTTPTKARLWESESAGAISAAMRGACPGSGWTRSSIVVNNVTNTRSGIDRDIFTYECNVSVAGACPASTADYTKIENVGISLWVDQDTTDRASELDVTTAVFLRNQNEAPTAVVSDPRTISLPLRKYLLNGSGSTDPEGRTLEYFWFEGAPPSASTIASTPCTAVPAGTKWQGVTYLRTFDTTTPAGSNVDFYLLVRDPGCLTSLSSKVTVKAQ